MKPRRQTWPRLTRRACLVSLLLATIAAPSQSQNAADDSRDGDILGQLRLHRVQKDETLIDIALREGLGFVELRAANPGVDPWIPKLGQTLVLPTAHLLPDAPRLGIVINLAEQRLYYFRRRRPPVTFPVGIGRAGCETPTGETRIVRKREHPTWVPPASIRAERPDLPAAVPPGPWNPLGEHALDLGWESLVIHGTNQPLGIGRRVSHGCLRLYPADIAALFDAVEVGTRVRIVDQPVKLGWSGGELYLEVHPTQTQADELEATGRLTPEPVFGLNAKLLRTAGEAAARLDWQAIEVTARERRGIPIRVTR
ncbi:MAG: L,D-transpeptidase family protein [Kiloniellales bacterium]|nr:L,D-transpeptidase family protein [Kiloniellales bacterium]